MPCASILLSPDWIVQPGSAEFFTSRTYDSPSETCRFSRGLALGGAARACLRARSRTGLRRPPGAGRRRALLAVRRSVAASALAGAARPGRTGDASPADAPARRAGAGRRPDRRRRPGRAGPLALPGRHERACGRRPRRFRRSAGAGRRHRRRAQELALPAPARPEPCRHRRARPLGPRAADRGPGDEDRDHRRRHRPPASVLRSRPGMRCRPAFRRARPPTRPRR